MATITRFIRTSADSGGTGANNTDSGGTHAYDSLANAIIGEDGVDHSGNDLILICSVGSGSAADTSIAYFNNANWSTPPDSITVQSADGISATYDTAKYRLEGASGYSATLRYAVSTDFTVEDLQVSVTGSGSTASGIWFIPVATSIGIIRRNIVKQGSAAHNRFGIRVSSIETSGEECDIVNNVVYDFTNGSTGIGILDNHTFLGGTIAIYNNTIDSCQTNLSSGSNSGGAGVIRIFNNCLTNGVGVDYSENSYAGRTTDNNVTSDATGPDSAHIDKTITYADAGGKDFQTSDSDIVGLGTDLSADGTYAFDIDLLSVSRGGVFDIGAFQDVSAAGGDLLLTNRSIANYGGMRQ